MVVVYVIVWGLYERVLIGLGVVLWVGWELREVDLGVYWVGGVWVWVWVYGVMWKSLGGEWLLFC